MQSWKKARKPESFDHPAVTVITPDGYRKVWPPLAFIRMFKRKKKK